MGTQKRAVAIMDYRYDEGCRVRKEPICPTIARLSDRGGDSRKAFGGGNMDERRKIRIRQATKLGYIYILAVCLTTAFLIAKQGEGECRTRAKFVLRL